MKVNIMFLAATGLLTLRLVAGAQETPLGPPGTPPGHGGTPPGHGNPPESGTPTPCPSSTPKPPDSGTPPGEEGKPPDSGTPPGEEGKPPDSGTPPESGKPDPTQPNIVFMLFDNMGWGDISCQGGVTQTPNIDRIAKEGIRLANYQVECVCTPTRSAILTGRMPPRTGCWTVPIPGTWKGGLVPWEYTLGNLFSDAGYKTALYGKWHCGETQGRLPNDHGFDEWWGLSGSTDEAGYASYPLFKDSGMHTPMIMEGKKGEPSKEVEPLDLKIRPLLDTKITEKTIEYINTHAKNPFFVYMGMTLVHPPEVANAQFDRSGVSGMYQGRPAYADYIREADYHVGQILDAIKAAGIDNKTIIVVSSDNGIIRPSPEAGSSGPWRGNFFTIPYEGSIHTFALARAPGRLPADKVLDGLVCCEDWITTFASMLDKPLPKDRPIDGLNQLAYFYGKGVSARDYSYVWGGDGVLAAIKWKNYIMMLRYINPDSSEPGHAGFIKPSLPMFFDLVNDPQEQSEIFANSVDCGWLTYPIFQVIKRYVISTALFPNIRPGTPDLFPGYVLGLKGAALKQWVEANMKEPLSKPEEELTAEQQAEEEAPEQLTPQTPELPALPLPID